VIAYTGVMLLTAAGEVKPATL